MIISVSEQISVTSSLLLAHMPSLYQSNIGMIPGEIYRLSFDASFTSEIINVYQGSKLIYSNAIVFVGNADALYDKIRVLEKITIVRI